MANMISTIVLCDVPITPTNQRDFNNRTEQTKYFNSKAVRTCVDCKYIARTGQIKVKGYVDTFSNCNYGYYTNEYNGTQKTFYFWIVQKDALNRNTTALTIQLDVFQTWFLDLTFKPCMVERKHVTDDSIGANTYPEDFELGEYITRNRVPVTQMQGDMAYFVAITDSESGRIGGRFGKKYNGYSIVYFSYRSTDALSQFISDLCNEGKADSIAFIFPFPQRMLAESSFLSLQDGDVVGGIEGEMKATINFSTELNFAFDGLVNGYYEPKNKKLYTYPYNFITVTNPDGSNVVWKLELFQTNNITLSLDTVMGQNPIFALTPHNYCGRALSYEDSITTQGYGLCSWNNDNYGNWYAQHQHSIRAQSSNAINSFNANSIVNSNNYTTAKSVNDINRNRNTANTVLDSAGALASGLSLDPVKIAGGVVNAGLTAGKGYINTNADYTISAKGYNNDLANANLMNAVNYENTMRSLLGSVKDAQVQPNTAKGDTSACGLDMARDTMTFYINQTQIRPDYAKRIDMFFQMYGYQVNTVEIPRFNTRLYWNYIKTTNCTAVGNVPLEDKQALENIINNGLTIWHDEEHMFNYELNNEIITIIQGEV